jgi:hypothetical protein
MIELAMRAPINLSPTQRLIGLFLAAVVLLALIVWASMETLLSGGVGLWLRLTGHKPPRKSTFEMELDDLEARLRKRDEDSRTG